MPKARIDDPLTADRLREILDYDRNTGLFIWRHRSDARPQTNGYFVGKQAGCSMANGYVVIGIAGRLYLAHRLAWLYVTGDWPADNIDHRDTDRSNNRYLNLREATQLQNGKNRAKSSRNTTGLKGVSWHKKAAKWSAQIVTGGKNRYLGLFTTPEAAHAAYRDAAMALHGDFARFD